MERMPQEQMPERLFTVIDSQTGKEPDLEQIALKEKWAQNLMYCDMEGFVLDSEGELFLLDECGNYASVPEGRFPVVFPATSISALAERVERAGALLSVVELVSSFLVSLHRQWISDSDSVVRDAAKSYQGTVEELFSSVRKLNAFQLGQLRKLIAHYRASLMNIVEYAPSEREEWYAGAVWNLTEDVNSYLRQSPHHLTGGKP